MFLAFVSIQFEKTFFTSFVIKLNNLKSHEGILKNSIEENILKRVQKSQDVVDFIKRTFILF